MARRYRIETPDYRIASQGLDYILMALESHDMTSANNSAPVIVAPVSRLLSVADPERSRVFYRDVLGFEVGPGDGDTLEATHGPARIQFTDATHAHDSTGAERPRGAAVLFFQVDDVARWHALVVRRGGHPSEPEKINGIKMEVFQIRDPDGHTLWFGQSFQQPGLVQAPVMMRKIMPSLPVADVPAAVAHYRDVLGFAVNYAQHDLGVMDRDDARIILFARSAHFAGIGACYVYVRDADALHAELTAKRANLQGEPVSQPWGLREFTALDPDGNEITFGQTFE